MFIAKDIMSFCDICKSTPDELEYNVTFVDNTNKELQVCEQCSSHMLEDNTCFICDTHYESYDVIKILSETPSVIDKTSCSAKDAVIVMCHPSCHTRVRALKQYI